MNMLGTEDLKNVKRRPSLLPIDLCFGVKEKGQGVVMDQQYIKDLR